ncbi:hypothetical protein ONZ45_g14060 [Pleurotus djamor]|nr:hypothetical protein ONZ45_g14060 [Pleurotus djamor]
MTISLSILGAALGSMAMATYSGYYGRRPVYLIGLPLFCIGSYQIAVATQIYTLMFWRFFQTLGISSGMSVGGAVIGDIYRLEERGFAMGIFFSASLLGPAIAPVTGGISAHYASWRTVQWCFLFYGLALFLAIFLWLPETSHPGSLGIEKDQSLEGANGTTESSQRHYAWKWVWLNPFQCLRLLKSPNLLLVILAGTTSLFADFVLLVPIAYTIGARYGITNEAVIGAIFMPAGLGNMLGAPLAGYISDQKVIQWRAKRNGVWYPEDRLRATLFGAGFCVPVSLLMVGAAVQWIDDPTLGIGTCLVALFINGIGVDLVLSPMAAYFVDILHSRSAEGMAAGVGFRAVFLSALTSSILPMVNTYGQLATDAITAVLAWIGYALIVVVIRNGDAMRAWNKEDIEYSDTLETT